MPASIDEKTNNNFYSRVTWILLFWFILVTLLIEFKNFLYPVCLGIMFAFLLYPLANFFEKRRIPRIISNILSIIIGIGIVYAAMLFLYKKFDSFIEDMPHFQQQARGNLLAITAYIQEITGTTIDLTINSKKIGQLVSGHLNEAFNATTQTLYSIFILPVYVFFFLYYRNKFHDFFIILFKHEQQTKVSYIIDEISLVIGRYMSGVFTVVCILCITNSIGFYVIGLKYAILFGIVSAICNFIPYFGTILGFSIPFIFALLTGNSPTLAAGVIILFIITQFTENNILTPNIVGRMLRLSPLSVILGVTLGGFLWAIPGMFIIIPVIAIMKIIFDHDPDKKAWAYLLSNEGAEKYALSFKNIKSFFKK